MAGIYIHIPFCKQACNYCNFHFSTSLRYKNELIAALLKEIRLSAQIFFQPAGLGLVETIYFGGGTPSLLSRDELAAILDRIRQTYNVSPTAELTLEANPDDLSAAQLQSWKEIGINRLSIGIQSFFEEDLQWMNRAHTAQQAIENLNLATEYFDNITIDLIYGTPGLTNEKWKENVDRAIALGIPHLSCYALTVEPKTPLQKMIARHQRHDVDPVMQSAQFLLLMDWLSTAGYEHYEISNFAKPGFRSRHNSSYWQGKPYLGLGPSAHSFNGKARWWNIANNNVYIQSLVKDIIPFEIEELTAAQQLNEKVMISLRTMEGLNLSQLAPVDRERILREGKKFLENGLLKTEFDRLILTKEGKLLADGIAAELFL